jgi:hypothetical protein
MATSSSKCRSEAHGGLRGPRRSGRSMGLRDVLDNGRLGRVRKLVWAAAERPPLRRDRRFESALGIQEQAPEIKKNVEEETRNAVKALQPTITGIISDQLQAEVKNAVAPVEATMKAYLNLNVLSALARNDDREAFDQLMAMGNGEAAGDIKTLAAATALEVVREKTNVFRRLGRQFKEKQTPQAMLNIIGTSTFIPDRLTALDNYPPDDVSILPVLVKIIHSDQNLEMVATAFSSFDSRTKQEFQFPDYAGVVSWWEKNHDQFDHKQAQ